jgi:hypothetical protein
MEIKNFDSVSPSYARATKMKNFCEMVYTTLVNAGKQMTVTEICDAISYPCTTQRVTAHLRKLIVLGLVTRHEVVTGEKVTITPPDNPYYQPRKWSYREVFDANGKSLGEQCVQERIGEPFEVEVRVAYFKAV